MSISANFYVFALAISSLLAACATTPNSSSSGGKAPVTRFSIEYPAAADLDRTETISWIKEMRERDLTEQVIVACNDPAWLHENQSDNRGRIRQAKRALELDLPEGRLECWLREAQNIIPVRASEIAYFNILSRGLGGGVVLSSGEQDIMRSSIDGELINFNSYYKRRVLGHRQYWSRTLFDLRRRQRQERESWGRAFGQAMNEFAQDNPFNRPQPGMQNIVRTSSMVVNATPAQRIAMDNMDRTLFGNDAYYSALARDLAYRPPAQPATDESDASQGSSGIAITLEQGKYCASGIPGNDCPSESEWQEYHQSLSEARREQALADHADYLRENVARAEAMAEERRQQQPACRRRVAERTLTASEEERKRLTMCM